jgi:hypothetical protein
MSTATIIDRSIETSGDTDRLTEALEEKLSHPATFADFVIENVCNEVFLEVVV